MPKTLRIKGKCSCGKRMRDGKKLTVHAIKYGHRIESAPKKSSHKER